MNLNRIFAGAGLILLPFIFELSGDDQLRAPKAKMLFILAAFYVGAKLWSKGMEALGAGLALVFVSAYFSKTIFSLEDLAVFLAAGISCFWVAIPKKHELEGFYKIAEALGLAIAFYGLVQAAGYDPILNYYSWADKGRPVILFGQHTLYGPFAVMMFAIALFRAHYLRALFLAIPVLLINSSFTLLAFGVVIGIFLVRHIPFRFVFLAGFLVSLGLVAFRHENPVVEEAMNDKGRFVLWSQTIELASKRPFLGYGPGTFRVIYPTFQDPELRRMNGIKDSELSPYTKDFIKKAEHLKAESGYFLNPHSSFLHIYFAFGAVGIAVALWILLHFSFSFWQQKSVPEAWLLAAIFYSFLANSLGSFPFELIPQALFPLWAYVAMTTMRRAAILEEYADT